MSFIAVDLKFLEMEGPAAARAAGVSEDRVLAGALRLWKLCWAQKKTSVSRGELAGCFGSEGLDGLLTALEEHMLTRDAAETPSWRVRGAEKYLRISAARSRGGKASVGNLKRGKSPGSSRKPAGAQPEVVSGLLPGLTPNTEHRTPNIKNTPPDKPAAMRESDLLLEDFLKVTGSAYLWNGAQDGAAFARLSKAANIGEIRIRWRRGLSAPVNEWRSVRTVSQLASKWNDLAEDKTTAQQPPKQVLRHL